MFSEMNRIIKLTFTILFLSALLSIVSFALIRCKTNEKPKVIAVPTKSDAP